MIKKSSFSKADWKYVYRKYAVIDQMSLQAFVILLTRVTILRFLKIALKKAGKKKVFRINVNLKNAIKFLSMSKN